MSIKAISLLLAVVFLAGCQGNVKNSEELKPTSEVSQAKPLAEKPVPQTTSVRHAEVNKKPLDKMTQRLIKLGQEAFAEDRLLTPEEDNANLYFQVVLGRDPGNYQATMGLVDIVDKYLQWAWQSAQQGDYHKAQLYLGNAKSVNPEDPSIAEMTTRIANLKAQQEQKAQQAQTADQASKFEQPKSVTLEAKSTPVAKDGQFYLPSNLFSLSETEILAKLQPIIDRVAKDKKAIDIDWPNDKEARLLYQIINSRVSEFRVRAMIYHRSDYMIELQKN